MPKKKQEAAGDANDPLLVSAAKTVGNIAGKVAATLGATPAAAPRKRSPKLPPKNKARLPRKLKKAQRTSAPAR